MDQLSTRRQLTGTALKYIACGSMLLDHLGASLLEAGVFLHPATSTRCLLALDTLLRWAGRLAFPIYCFLLVEGFVHTHSLRRYIGRLLLFGLLSEIPFDLAFFRTAFYWQHQNVYWTLALGTAALWILQQTGQDGPTVWYGRLGVGCLALLAELLHTDYGAVGIILIALLYLLRQDRTELCILGSVLMAYELPAPLAFVPIWFYNGQRGRCSQVLQWGFYWFYPAHLALLAAAGTLFM